MSPEPSAARDGWAGLSARLRQAVLEVESTVAGAPLAGAEGLQRKLAQIAGCLTEAEELWRAGRREGLEDFRRELERWRQQRPVIRAWIESTSSLVGGWGAVAGTGAGYGPTGREAPAGPEGQAVQAGPG